MCPLLLLKIIKAPVADFIFSKIPCFQHIVLNTFRWMRFKYENYSLRYILFQALQQQSDYISLIAKTFDGNTLEMEAPGPIQVIKNKKQCFQLCLDRTYTLVLTTHFLRTEKSGAKKNILPPLVMPIVFNLLHGNYPLTLQLTNSNESHGCAS